MSGKVPLGILVAEERPVQLSVGSFGLYDEESQMSEYGAGLSGSTITGSTNDGGDYEHDQG